VKKDIPAKVRAAVRARSGGRCEFRFWPGDDLDAPLAGDVRCRRRATEMHHRLPRSRGGAHTVENLVHLCSPCHDWIEQNREEARHRGLLIATPPYDPLAKLRRSVGPIDPASLADLGGDAA
jgi:5-methylcytosine-specific restriction endonuclease McrA